MLSDLGILPPLETAADLDAARRDFTWPKPERFNIAESCCDRWAEACPERVALIHRGMDGSRREMTYGELRRESTRLAHRLRRVGVCAGDRVALHLSQSPEAMVAHMAIQRLGAVALPLFTLFGPDAIDYRLRDSGAVVAIAAENDMETLRSVAENLPEITLLLTGSGADGTTIEALMNTMPDEPLRVNTLAEDPAVLIYTSGTTGPPKGVLHAQRFLIGHLPCLEVCQSGYPAPDDVAWTPADWAWIGALMDLAMPALYYGVPLVSCRMRKFDAEAAYRLIAEERVTRLFLPPTALRLMRTVPVPDGVGPRSVISGGESLGTGLLDWARRDLGCGIEEIYGQTECNLVVGTGRRLERTPRGAMGRSLPGHSVAVLNGDGDPVMGGIGEIAVRRGDPAMFLEYWNRPEATAKKFSGEWMLTGDLGVMDEDGFITFAGRDDDVITSAGYRIGPTEIENCLTSHADVLMAAVVGAPDPVRTEIVVAHVVLKDGASRDGLADELTALVRERVSPHVAPRRVLFVDGLPTTATGKIMRRALRDAG